MDSKIKFFTTIRDVTHFDGDASIVKYILYPVSDKDLDTLESGRRSLLGPYTRL